MFIVETTAAPEFRLKVPLLRLKSPPKLSVVAAVLNETDPVPVERMFKFSFTVVKPPAKLRFVTVKLGVFQVKFLKVCDKPVGDNVVVPLIKQVEPAFQFDVGTTPPFCAWLYVPVAKTLVVVAVDPLI